MSRLPEHGARQPISPGVVERQVVEFFIDGVKVLGMPRSIGEIYGLLFVSQEPRSLDDLVMALGISKGSASQGLRALKGLGAIREVQVGTERRTYFVASLELKRLVGGFIREQIRPHLESGRNKIHKLEEAARCEEDPARRQFLSDRLNQLEHWLKSGGRLLPIVQKLLGE